MDEVRRAVDRVDEPLVVSVGIDVLILLFANDAVGGEVVADHVDDEFLAGNIDVADKVKRGLLADIQRVQIAAFAIDELPSLEGCLDCNFQLCGGHFRCFYRE